MNTKPLFIEKKHWPYVLEILHTYNVESYFQVTRSEEGIMLQLTDTVPVGVLFELKAMCA